MLLEMCDCVRGGRGGGGGGGGDQPAGLSLYCI